MHVILITEENLPKIREVATFDPAKDEKSLTLCLSLKEPWYFAQGFSTERGVFLPHAMFPAYYIHKYFEIDIEHAKTDWDQIVRK